MKLRIGLVIISLILSFLIGLMLSFGSSENVSKKSSDKKILIGFSMATLKQARWQKDRDIFVNKANALGAEVMVQSANGDDTRQIQDIQSLISNKVDVLVVVPHNGKAMSKAVTLANENNIPIIAYDRMITDADLDLYISFDNIRIGKTQAQYIIDQLPQNRKMRIVRIYGSNTDNNAHLFKKGQDEVLAPYIENGKIEVIHEDWAESWKPEVAKKITNAAITQHGSTFDAILASNDGTAGGAIQALKEEGLSGKIFVTGQDADLVACQRIVAGSQSMSIYKPLTKLAEKGAEVAVKLAMGKPIIVKEGLFNGKVEVPSILLETVTVTKENIDQTVIADNFHAADDVYRNISKK